MKGFQRLTGRFYSDKILRNLFVCWFLLYPFDAHVLPVSIGFMTLYPFLILTFLLLAYSFSHPLRETPGRTEHLSWIFFIAWLLFAICLFPFVNAKSYAFFEIRSLLMLAATFFLLFRVRYLLGVPAFFDLIFRLSVFIFISLSLTGLFEFFSGIHFAGTFSEKLTTLPAGNITYAPVFLYDNPNSFLSYIFSSGIILFLTSVRLSREILKSSFILFILLFFSIVADSKFGKLASCLLFAISLVNYFYGSSLFSKRPEWFKWAGFYSIALLLTLAIKPLFFGPMWKNGQDYLIPLINPAEVVDEKLVFYSSDSLVKRFGKDAVVHSYLRSKEKDMMWATNIRKNLILNGFYLLRQSNGVGVGPGQYRYYHEAKKVPYPTSTLTSPHNSLVEIGSQYGVVILVPFLIILLSKWRSVLRYRKSRFAYFLTYSACLCCYFIVSDMPSAWLILSNAWILLSIQILAPDQLKEDAHG